MEMPINRPIPKVIAAAANPNITCLNPEYHTFLPVNNVIAEPMINNPKALQITLITTALKPLEKMNGKTGITAPIENKINE